MELVGFYQNQGLLTISKIYGVNITLLLKGQLICNK
jgi:hypothetical protein